MPWAIDQSQRTRRLPHDVGSGELVDEAEGGGEQPAEVDGPPDLVPDPVPYGPGGGDADGDEEDGARRGGGDRPVPQQAPGGGDEVGTGVHGVPAERKEGVRADQTQDVPAAEGVPAGEPVGADAVLDGRDAGHEQQQDEDAVPGEQTGEVRAGREEGVEAGGGPGLHTPEQGDGPGAAEDRAPQAVGGEPQDGKGRGGTGWCGGRGRRRGRSGAAARAGAGAGSARRDT